MSNVRIFNSKLIKWFVLSQLIVNLLFLLGPYKYKIYSYAGIIYNIVCVVLFLLGMSIKTTANGYSNLTYDFEDKRKIDKSNYYSNRNVILFFEVVSIIFFAIYVLTLWNQFGVTLFSFSQNLTDKIGSDRSLLNKISEIGTSFGVVCFLYTNVMDIDKKSLTYRLSLLTIWLPGIITLLLGVRWGIVICAFIFLQVINPLKIIKKHKIAALGLAVWLLFVIFAISKLFLHRGILTAGESYLFVPGDMEMRKFWKDMYVNSNGSLEVFFKLSNYISHSIAAFSYIFMYRLPHKIYFGANMFRAVGFVLQPLGIPFTSFKDIYSDAFSGYYSGFVYGYIIDWGKYFAPLFVFLTGVVFRKIEINKKNSILFKAFYPLCITMVAFSPIYYFFQLAGMDFKILCLLIFEIVRRVMVRIRVKI